jgi:PAS domain S-box-containing protein
MAQWIAPEPPRGNNERDTKRILLVEDEEVVALGLSLALQSGGYAVTTAAGGAEAVERVSEPGSEFHLVLMDLVLPGPMDGAEAARRIFSKRELPVVFLSGHDRPDVIQRTEEAFSFGFIPKQISRVGLLTAVRIALELFASHRALGESEGRLRSLFETAAAGLAVTDLNGTLVQVNARMAEITGRTRGDLEGRQIWDIVHPDHRERARAQLMDVANNRSVGYRLEKPYVRPDGSTVWVDSAVSPVCDRNGRVLQVAAVVVDISSRRSLEVRLRDSIAEQETLLRELQHRVKNTLSTVASLVSLERQALQDSAGREALERVYQRIAGIVAVYDSLTAGPQGTEVDLRGVIDSLLDGLAAAYFRESDPVTIERRTESVHIDLRRAVSVGILVNELVTNAFKHAFPEGRPGRIRVACSPGPDGSRCTVAVEDNGVGYRAQTAGTSFGRELVAMLVEQIGGTMGTSQNDGVRVWVEIPLTLSAGPSHD